jgi:uncharacterized protein YndB with AHSA1/START domain
MEKLNFNITIDAPIEKVWNILWNDSTYREWTSAFSEGSHAISDFRKGSKVLFLDGKGSGMVSRVADVRIPEFMSFEHLGEVRDGVEDTESERVKPWAGSKENYTLKSLGDKTEVFIEMDITDDFKDMFSQLWPKALQQLKDVAEREVHEEA